MILIYFAKSEATILHDLLNKYVSKSAPKTQKCQIVTAAYTVKNLRISADILWRVFHILTESVPYTFVCGPDLYYSVDLRNTIIFKFCTQRDNIKLCHKGMTNHPQKGRCWANVTIFFMRNIISPPRAVKWGQQRRRRWTSVAHIYNGRR